MIKPLLLGKENPTGYVGFRASLAFILQIGLKKGSSRGVNWRSGLIAQVYASTPAGRDKVSTDFTVDKVGGRCPSCRKRQGRCFYGVCGRYRSECPACRGERFRSEILEVTHRGKTIAQVLSMSVDSVYTLLVREKRIAERLKWLIDQGFGHLKLGSQVANGLKQCVCG